MPNYGFNAKERDLIVRYISKWMKTYPENWDWTKSNIKITDRNVSNWKNGDIIDIQPDHLKIYVIHTIRKWDARQWAKDVIGDFYGNAYNGYTVFKYKYFPDPENILEIKDNNWSMKITSYDGALRIYKQLTGKKFDGFESFGRDVYH